MDESLLIYGSKCTQEEGQQKHPLQRSSTRFTRYTARKEGAALTDASAPVEAVS